MVLAIYTALAACASSSTPPVAVSGDFRDVVPAVRAAASEVEMAVLAYDSPEPGVHAFELVSVRDEPATLTVTADDDAPRGFRAEATVGRLGDPGREEALVRAFLDRLAELGDAGGEAPLSE